MCCPFFGGSVYIRIHIYTQTSGISQLRMYQFCVDLSGISVINRPKSYPWHWVVKPKSDTIACQPYSRWYRSQNRLATKAGQSINHCPNHPHGPRYQCSLMLWTSDWTLVVWSYCACLSLVVRNCILLLMLYFHPRPGEFFRQTFIFVSISNVINCTNTHMMLRFGIPFMASNDMTVKYVVRSVASTFH